MMPGELIAALQDRGRSEEEAAAIILDWAGWRGLHATGLFYRVRATGAGGRTIEKARCRERSDVPRRFWHFVARADLSDRTRAASLWTRNSFSFTLVVPPGSEGEHIAPGEYQDTWESVLFDRSAAEALLDRAEDRSRRKGGRPSWAHWPACVEAVVAAIEAEPDAFINSAGGVRMTSADPWDRCALDVAIGYRDDGRDGPADETLLRKLPALLRPKLDALGYRLGK